MFRTVFALVALIFLTTSAIAEVSTRTKVIEFLPSDAPLTNPERGFWQFAADDFSAVKPEDLIEMRAKGITIAYAIVRLDKFRSGPLTPSILEKLDLAFAHARTAGIKVILRFAYNYPQSSDEYSQAKDAPLYLVLQHIQQLAPVINLNKDVLAVMQAGFIGAWGEAHTSSNNLDSAENKAKIRDALLASLDQSIAIQWRYPQDVIAWEGKIDNEMARIAFHNDCFLSSTTDVGTYSENGKIRARQRDAMEQLTGRTFFSGETCDAERKQIRSDCRFILNEGAQFHLSALGLDYYEVFHKTWKKEGCFAAISNQMGYRLELGTATFDDKISPSSHLTIVIKNNGWAKLYKSRSLVLDVFGKAGEFLKRESTGDLASIGPSETATFVFLLSDKKFEFDEPHTYCLSAPDPEESLKDDIRYSLKFANSENLGKGQTYDSKKGLFCFDTDHAVEK
jgi:Domain of unknown function (DUF4874)/Domain of unknown function (DUF4832)